MRKLLFSLVFVFFFVILLTILYLYKIDKNELKEDFTASFYFWENSYNLDQEVLEENKGLLYIKILDIKYSNRLEIIKTNFIKNPPKDFVPVIYITNKTFQNIDYKDLVNKILPFIKNNSFLNFSELQIDCDFSDSTKSNYFLFLEELKKELNIVLSATIRLHQIKYFQKTGVPPVDYGLLMYYNMSNLADFKTRNYILDNSEAKKYHYNFDKYPLKLKLALPLYSQAVQFRDEKTINLFEGVFEDDFLENFEKLENSRFKVLKSHYFKGKYIYKDDIFRLETVKEDELKTAFNDFLKLSNNYFNEVIFYTIKYKNRYNLQKLLQNSSN